MGIFDFLTGSNSGYAKNLERSLAGINLGTEQSFFECDSDWEELKGPAKAQFQSGLPNEKIFVSTGNNLVVCGCVLNQVYKIAYVVETTDGHIRVSGLTQQYGQPKKKGALHTWQNETISLEVSVRSTQVNMMLTDRQLLTKAYR